MDLTLYSYWRSSAAYRVRLALAFKGLAHATEPVNLLHGAQSGIGFKMLNPQGLVPLLIADDVAIPQSLAILEWLDETHPEPPLLPGAPAERARIRAAALGLIADTHPLINLRVLKYLKASMGQGQDAIDAWARHWIEDGLAALEEVAEGTATRDADAPYLFGAEVTLADICLVAQMYSARRLRAGLDHVPRLVEIDKRLNALAWVRAAAPEAQADAPDEVRRPA